MRATIKAMRRAVGRLTVAEADDGDVALAQVGRFKPAVVLCDIALPRLGGLRSVKQLRKRPEAWMRDTPVVMLTGHTEETMVFNAAQLKIDGYLIKPISPKFLSDHLQGILTKP